MFLKLEHILVAVIMLDLIPSDFRYDTLFVKLV
jgi:hypothetical protein